MDIIISISEYIKTKPFLNLMSTRKTIQNFLSENYPDIYQEYLTTTRNNRLKKNRDYMKVFRENNRIKCENCDKTYIKGQHKLHNKRCIIRDGYKFLDD